MELPVTQSLIAAGGMLGGAAVAALVSRKGQKSLDLKDLNERLDRELVRVDGQLLKTRGDYDTAQMEIKALTNQVADLQRTQQDCETEKGVLQKAHMKVIAEKEARIAELETLTADLAVRLDKLEQQKVSATRGYK